MTDPQDKINDRQASINEQLFAHVKIANEEMGGIKIDMAAVKADISWMKTAIEKLDARVWYILATIIGGFVINIFLTYLRHG